jgi:hypothetical protein
LHRRGANAELRTELAHLVFSTLISEFRFMRHGVAEPQQLPLFGAGGVFEKLTPRFAETAMVKDTDVPEFLLLLEQELKSHLLKRPTISGQWGTLAALDGEIIVRLTACDKLDGDRSSVTSRTLDIVL